MHVAHKISSLKVVTKPSWSGTDHIHSSVEGILLQETAKKYTTILAIVIIGRGGGKITYTVICAISYCPFLIR